MHKKILAVFLIGILISCLLGGCFQQNSKSPEGPVGKIAFDSVTLTDAPVDATIFASYRLTAINVWATWCRPCVEEMPELQNLYQALPEDVHFISICLDGEDDPDLARQITEESKTQFDTVVANKEMLQGFLSSIQSIPTTLFADANGTIVGDPFVGAPASRVVETYLSQIQAHLALLDE